MKLTRYTPLAFVLLALLSLRAEEKLDPAGVDFFENKIRPLLAEHCYSCHSEKAEKLKGDLYLDSRDGLLKGGESGPAIIPGDAENSLLIRAVRYTDEHLQMPPKDKKLSEEQISDLVNWVNIGAPDPRTKVNEALVEREQRKSNHWAFQPIQIPPLPEVKKQDWVKNPIDAFILAKLEANDLLPSEPADRRTFIRRATFDLHGLPPTPAEVEDFVKDTSPQAYEILVDRLLASTRYGERWGRHWLDIARYSDTKGYVFEEERRYPYSYTYRDYVIRSLNEDVPFNRFIIEQIAADQLELGDDKRPLAAMGFLTLGRRFLNNQHDIIDDRIDVVTRGFMGLTVQCARCHDHKYDPIPTADYYSLYGVFASSSEPGEKPLLGNASLPKDFPAYEVERKKRETELNEFRATKYAEVRAQVRANASEYMLTAFDASKLEDKSKEDNLAKERKLEPKVLRRWVEFLEERRKAEHDSIFAPWFAFTALSEDDFASKAPEISARFSQHEGEKPISPIVAKNFAGEPPASIKAVAGKYKAIFAEVDQAWTTALKENADLAKLNDENQEQVRQILFAENSPSHLKDGEIPRMFDVPTAQRNRALQRQLEELDAVHPGAPPRAMVMVDNPNPANPRIFVRGAPGNPGPEVPRQFLELIEGTDRKPFEKGSGRLELAQAIASDDNPLTARVIVNRVWLNHFNAGLVKTPSDFGLRADPPTHPELLDYLAGWFIDQGWSLKKLHRLIVLSNTYRQKSESRPDYELKDPNNELLWRMNLRRLEFEPFRDTLLAVSGKLDLTEGGQPVDITSQPFPPRRSVYAFIERQNLPGLFRTFDFASPDTTSPQRFNTTVPQQALFMINSPFVAEQARLFFSRPEVNHGKSTREKVQAFYQTAFQRDPTEDEIRHAEEFIQSQAELASPEPPPEIWHYGYGALNTESGRLASFQKLPHFTGDTWRGGANLPDEKLGWLLLNRTGGHPGEGLNNVIVRRWIAPDDLTISISGRLEHPTDAGNGVRGRIISSRTGEVGSWSVHNAGHDMSVPRLEVKKGDTVDFIVDSNGDLNSDGFTWAPEIEALAQSGSSGTARTWDAREDFSGPPPVQNPLSPWEKYAQVLLMSNELAFID